MDVFHVYEMRLCPLFSLHYGNENVSVILSVSPLLKRALPGSGLFSVWEKIICLEIVSVLSTQFIGSLQTIIIFAQFQRAF